MLNLSKVFLVGLTFHQSGILKGVLREGVKLWGRFSVAV